MIVSIHQPQYIPWLPYYSKISNSDIFVFLDNVQFQKNGLHNRNELKNSNGRFWLTIPISFNLGDKLSDIKVIDRRWFKKHVKSIVKKNPKTRKLCNEKSVNNNNDFENCVEYVALWSATDIAKQIGKTKKWVFMNYRVDIWDIPKR